MLPSASRDGTAAAGALTTAIAAAVEELRDPVGAKHGTHRRYFLVSEFLDTVRAHLRRAHPGQDVVPLGYRGAIERRAPLPAQPALRRAGHRRHPAPAPRARAAQDRPGHPLGAPPERHRHRDGAVAVHRPRRR